MDEHLGDKASVQSLSSQPLLQPTTSTAQSTSAASVSSLPTSTASAASGSDGPILFKMTFA